MPSGKHQSGFTYIGLLIVVAVIAASATAALSAGVTFQQRQAEAELLAIGGEYREALQGYADATPQGQPTEPRTLEALLRDPRQPGVVRHLRRIYHDPLTGKSEWGLVHNPAGRIVGIHSLSAAPTIRQTGFPSGMEDFAKATSYREWVFALSPQHGMQRKL